MTDFKIGDRVTIHCGAATEAAFGILPKMHLLEGSIGEIMEVFPKCDAHPAGCEIGMWSWALEDLTLCGIEPPSPIQDDTTVDQDIMESIRNFCR